MSPKVRGPCGALAISDILIKMARKNQRSYWLRPGVSRSYPHLLGDRSKQIIEYFHPPDQIRGESNNFSLALQNQISCDQRILHPSRFNTLYPVASITIAGAEYSLPIFSPRCTGFVLRICASADMKLWVGDLVRAIITCSKCRRISFTDHFSFKNASTDVPWIPQPSRKHTDAIRSTVPMPFVPDLPALHPSLYLPWCLPQHLDLLYLRSSAVRSSSCALSKSFLVEIPNSV